MEAFWIGVLSAAGIGYAASMLVIAARAISQERAWMQRRDLGS